MGEPMTYRALGFDWQHSELTTILTEAGWKVPGRPEIAGALDVLADPGLFGPADGDPMACAVARAAEILKGKGDAVPLPGPPPGTVY